MKRAFAFIFLITIAFTFVHGQSTKPVYLHGKVMDANKNVLSGASVILLGTQKGVNANEKGEYFFNQLPSGKLTVKTSFMGFKTHTIDITVHPGQNYLNFTLVEDKIHLEPVTVIAQKR